MKLTKSYQNVTIETSITKDQMKKIMTHCPESLVLKDTDTKKAIFAVEVGMPGAITSGGIRFDNITGTSGNYFVTVTEKDMPDEAEAAKTYLADTFGTILAKLNRVEAQATAALATLATEISTVTDSIVVD